MVEAEEQALVKKLVTHAAVKTLAEAILHRLARCDESKHTVWTADWSVWLPSLEECRIVFVHLDKVDQALDAEVGKRHDRS
jgi:hypothetical protein